MLTGTHTSWYLQHQEHWTQPLLELRSTLAFTVQLPYFTDEERETLSVRRSDLPNSTHLPGQGSFWNTTAVKAYSVVSIPPANAPQCTQTTHTRSCIHISNIQKQQGGTWWFCLPPSRDQVHSFTVPSFVGSFTDSFIQPSSDPQIFSEHLLYVKYWAWESRK